MSDQKPRSELLEHRRGWRGKQLSVGLLFELYCWAKSTANLWANTSVGIFLGPSFLKV